MRSDNSYYDDDYAPVESDFDKGYSLGRLQGEQYIRTKLEVEYDQHKKDFEGRLLNTAQTKYNQGFEDGKREGSNALRPVAPSLKRIMIIKFVREKFGVALKDAKDLVDENVTTDDYGNLDILRLVEKIYEKGFKNGVTKAKRRSLG